MPRKATKWTESAMWSGLKLVGEPLASGFTLRRLEAVAPGWPDIIGASRTGGRVTLVELKVLPASVHVMLDVWRAQDDGKPRTRWTWDALAAHVKAGWRIPFRDAQPHFLRGWAADGCRALVLCDVQPFTMSIDQMYTLVYVAKAMPEWLRRVVQVAPPPDLVLCRSSKYAWSPSQIRELLFP
jgi:hypothetical protein